MFHRDFWSYSYPQLVAVRFVEPSTTATPKMGWQYHHRTVGWFVISGYTNFGKRVGPLGKVYTRLEGKDISRLDRGRRWDDHPPNGIINKFPYSSVPTKSPKLRSFSLSIPIMRGLCSPGCAIKRRRKRGGRHMMLKAEVLRIVRPIMMMPDWSTRFSGMRNTMLEKEGDVTLPQADITISVSRFQPSRVSPNAR